MKHETRNTKHETRNTKHETRWSLSRILLVLAVTAMSSFSARAGDWPATGKEFLDKNKVTYRVNDRAQLVINIKKMTYSAYAPGGGATFCRGGEISTIIEISDSVIEIDAVPNKETKCLGKLLTINLKEKSATLIDYDFTGNRADVKGSYKVDSPNFD